MIRKIILAAVVTSSLGQVSFANGHSGAYLAGRHASLSNEFSKASEYNARVLGFDQENQIAFDNLMLSYIALGQVQRAVPVAQSFLNKDKNSQISDLVVLTDLIKNNEFQEILSAIGDTIDVNSLVNGLIQAWAEAGAGRIDAADARFDEFSNDQRLSDFAQFHKAMMFTSIGQMDRALPLLEQVDVRFRGIGQRAFLTRLKILVNQGEREAALKVFDSVYDAVGDPELATLRSQLEAGTLPSVTLPQSVSQGMAEVFLSIASFVISDSEPVFALLYARLAQALSDQDVETILLSAQMLDELGQYDMAVREYSKTPVDHPKFYAAELGRFNVMVAMGNQDGGIEVLEQLVRLRPDVPIGFAALGDTLRRADRPNEAKAAYDTAIDLYKAKNEEPWRMYYARGIVHSMLDDWPNTEADFRQALTLNPDQPQVLNYLGYSMVEKKINLDEALAMIQTAVDQSPDSGYIIDSLGWAKFRLGRFEEALPHLERAAELMPVDPLVNDHLGDAYWAVGRKLEAAFQWRRALSFDPEEKEIDRIRRKLEVGLDQVLIEEGEPPTTQTVQND